MHVPDVPDVPKNKLTLCTALACAALLAAPAPPDAQHTAIYTSVALLLWTIGATLAVTTKRRASASYAAHHDREMSCSIDGSIQSTDRSGDYAGGPMRTISDAMAYKRLAGFLCR